MPTDGLVSARPFVSARRLVSADGFVPAIVVPGDRVVGRAHGASVGAGPAGADRELPLVGPVRGRLGAGPPLDQRPFPGTRASALGRRAGVPPFVWAVRAGTWPAVPAGLPPVGIQGASAVVRGDGCRRVMVDPGGCLPTRVGLPAGRAVGARFAPLTWPLEARFPPVEAGFAPVKAGFAPVKAGFAPLTRAVVAGFAALTRAVVAGFAALGRALEAGFVSVASAVVTVAAPIRRAVGAGVAPLHRAARARAGRSVGRTPALFRPARSRLGTVRELVGLR
ncbi:hypothetical protein [Micromonospora narathiwatensis]|uniref:hypothetical protein n=1 Tax=Micromonospora narathiwatensis TaxID=299146 RepID=UPI0014320CA5|nr:hypothetical protein [Micromonospora narathiwatensis]